MSCVFIKRKFLREHKSIIEPYAGIESIRFVARGASYFTLIKDYYN